MQFAGQIHLHGVPLLFLAGDAQGAAVQMDNFARNGQAQPKPALAVAGVLGGEIGRENPLQILRADAFAVVNDLEPVPVAAQLGLGQRGQLNFNPAAGDARRPPRWKAGCRSAA